MWTEEEVWRERRCEEGAPHLARAVVAARDETVARLVEGAVRQREDVRAQDLEQVEALVLVRLLLLDQLVHQLAQLRLSRIGDEGLLADQLVDQHLHVGVWRQRQQVDRLVLQLRAQEAAATSERWR